MGAVFVTNEGETHIEEFGEKCLRNDTALKT